MEFSIVIPKVIPKVLEENSTRVKEKCLYCRIPCDSWIKFICLGFNAASIAEYIQKHPEEVEKMEEDGKKDLFDFYENIEDPIPYLFDEEE